jgi:hypothetical protein
MKPGSDLSDRQILRGIPEEVKEKILSSVDPIRMQLALAGFLRFARNTSKEGDEITHTALSS